MNFKKIIVLIGVLLIFSGCSPQLETIQIEKDSEQLVSMTEEEYVTSIYTYEYDQYYDEIGMDFEEWIEEGYMSTAIMFTEFIEVDSEDVINDDDYEDYEDLVLAKVEFSWINEDYIDASYIKVPGVISIIGYDADSDIDWEQLSDGVIKVSEYESELYVFYEEEELESEELVIDVDDLEDHYYIEDFTMDEEFSHCSIGAEFEDEEDFMQSTGIKFGYDYGVEDFLDDYEYDEYDDLIDALELVYIEDGEDVDEDELEEKEDDYYIQRFDTYGNIYESYFRVPGTIVMISESADYEVVDYATVFVEEVDDDNEFGMYVYVVYEH